MIATLLVTLLTEGMVVIAYALWRKKPLGPILLTSIFANIVTQTLLWVALNVFFQDYVATLLIAEMLIWLIESICLYGFRLNRLNLKEALALSFSINLASFALGLFFP